MVLEHILVHKHTHCVLDKSDQQYFWHNFDKFKCIVVILCEEYHKDNAKLLTQQKPASSNQCRYFTLQIRQS